MTEVYVKADLSPRFGYRTVEGRIDGYLSSGGDFYAIVIAEGKLYPVRIESITVTGQGEPL